MVKDNADDDNDHDDGADDDDDDDDDAEDVDKLLLSPKLYPIKLHLLFRYHSPPCEQEQH